MDDLDLDLSGVESKTSGVEKTELLVGTGYATVSLRGSWNRALLDLTPEVVDSLFASDPKLVLLNFSYTDTDCKVTSDELSLLKVIVHDLQKRAKKIGKKLALIRCPPELKGCLTVDASAAAYPSLYATLAEALKADGVGTLLSGEAELNLLSKAVEEVFQKQFAMTVIPHIPVMLADASAVGFGGDVIGLVPLRTAGATGTLLVRFFFPTLLALGRLTFGDEIDKDDPEIPQIASEMINMVLGCAKEELNARGFGIEQALPQTFVTDGKSSEGSMVISRPSWRMDFDSQVGSLSLEITLKHD